MPKLYNPNLHWESFIAFFSGNENRVVRKGSYNKVGCSFMGIKVGTKVYHSNIGTIKELLNRYHNSAGIPYVIIK